MELRAFKAEGFGGDCAWRVVDDRGDFHIRIAIPQSLREYSDQVEFKFSSGFWFYFTPKEVNDFNLCIDWQTFCYSKDSMEECIAVCLDVIEQLYKLKSKDEREDLSNA